LGPPKPDGVGGVDRVNVKIDGLKDAIREYLGGLNEVRAGGRASQMPPKPEAMILYEQCLNMQIPIVQGGLRDQPHIWLLEWRVIQQELELWEAVHRRNNEAVNAAQSQEFTSPFTSPF
jgi:hypothetical protein